MKAHVYAAASVCSAVVPWLTQLDTIFKFAGTMVALAAGILSIMINLRAWRKQKDKK